MKPTHILITLCLIICLLAAPAAAASVSDASGKTYTTYDQIYASTTLSSAEKLALVQEMAGWTPELEAYMEWKNSGGLEAYQAAVSGNSTSSDYGWDEAPGDGLGGSGTNIEPDYSYQERQAYDAAYAAYQAEFAENYAATAAYTGSGSGTEADPYIITTPAEFSEINSDLNAYYKLDNDIDFSGSGFSIGSLSIFFKGYLDGNGYAIKNVIASDHYSLIYCSDCTVENVKFSNIDLSKSGTCSFFRCDGGAYLNLINCVFEDITITGKSLGGICIYEGFNIQNCIITNTIVTVSGGESTHFSAVLLGMQSAHKASVINNCVVLDSSVSGRSPYIMSYKGSVNSYVGDSYKNGNVVTTSSLNDGTVISATQYNSDSWWKTTMSMWDWENVWQWNDETNLPELRNANNQAVPPTITSITATPSIGGQQDTYTLSVSASTTASGGIASYQWYGRIGSSGEWQAISDGTSATYQFVPGAYAVGDFYFKSVVTGADGGVIDSYDAGFVNVKITIVLAPQITSPAATPATGPLSQTVQLSASVTSTETVTYQWQELIGSTWTAISGATSATYTVSINDATPTTHSYRLQATNVGGTTTSATVTYTSVAPPTITAATANPTTGPLTQTVTLSATVSGATSYQWQQQSGSTWQNIAGATAATYTVSINDASPTTHSYRLQATNVGGTTTSATVTYTSVAAPTITAATANPTTGPLTQTVTLSATVSGATSYQWQQQTGSTWQNIAGATAATYTVSINDATPTTHSYRLQATNVGGTTTSATVTYTSVAAPTITAATANPTTGPLTQTVTLSATVSGATSYQWQQQSGSTWQNIQGATAATYTVSINDATPTTHTYRLQATNVGGTTTSATVTYTSVAAPTINTISASPASGPLTQTVTLTVSATGASNYQWQEQIGGNWQNIAGATTATHDVSISDSTPTLHTYRVIVSNVGGSTTSDTVTYQSSTGPIINTISATPTSGPLTQTVQLSVTANSANTITYQWQELIGSAWTNIQGATTPTYSVSITDTNPTTHRYRVLATDIGGTTPSETITYTSIAPPNIQGANINPAIGRYTETITLSAEVSGADTYQWQQNTGSGWQNIAGATTVPWIGTLTVSGDTQYRLLATNAGGTTTSSPIQYTIAGPANIQSLTATPSVVAIPGSTVLSATGTNIISWEWEQYVSGSWVSIANTASISKSFSDVGTYQFRVIATGADGNTVTSNTIEVLAGFAPSVSITSPTDGTKYQSGERIPVSATITGTDTTWEWDFGSRNIETGGNAQSTWVEYGIDGRYTINIRVVSVFGTAEDSITIVSGRESRPVATTPPIELESSGIFGVTGSLTPNNNGMPDLTGFVESLAKPFTDMIGAWFYFAVFAVPYLIIWIRQKNIIIPSILGVLFAAWILVQLPAAALPAAIALIVLSVTGGLYGIYVKLQNR